MKECEINVSPIDMWYCRLIKSESNSVAFFAFNHESRKVVGPNRWALDSKPVEEFNL
jgi:hypothetical protein